MPHGLAMIIGRWIVWGDAITSPPLSFLRALIHAVQEAAQDALANRQSTLGSARLVRTKLTGAFGHYTCCMKAADYSVV